MSEFFNKYHRVLGRVRSKLHRPPDGKRIVLVKPRYRMLDVLNANSVILDFGLGKDADFSVAMIEKYGLLALGFDPTRRHGEKLREVEQTSSGRFVYHNDAIGGERGQATFHESQQHVSGSMYTGHKNVQNDDIVSYDVKVITLADAIAQAPGGKVDLIKMDIEGAERGALDGASDELLRSVPQWCIEFHHESMEGISWASTKEYVRRFQRLGFTKYSRDDSDFLFYRWTPGQTAR